MRKNNKNRAKIVDLIGNSALVISLIFLVFLILFLFTLNFVIGLLAVILAFVLVILIFVLINSYKNKDILHLLHIYSLKKELLSKKGNIQKSYLKQEIREIDFLEEMDNLDKQIFQLDFDAIYFGNKNKSREEELREKINLLRKKYVKRDISQKLFNKLYFDLTKELAYLKPKKPKPKKRH
jgi:hypothetical protein